MNEPKRCGAWARQAERPCRNGAMLNGRCRLHGGKSTGPPEGSQNALKHGRYTGETLTRQRALKRLLRDISKEADERIADSYHDELE